MKWTATRKRASLRQNPNDRRTAATAALDKQEGRCHLQDCQLGEHHDVLVWFGVRRMYLFQYFVVFWAGCGGGPASSLSRRRRC